MSRARQTYTVLLLGVAFNGVLAAVFWLWPFMPQRSAGDPGKRAELVAIERPWAVPAPSTDAPKAPAVKIDLQQGASSLNQAIEEASAQADPSVRGCRLWGPFVAGDADRIASALSEWTGQSQRVEREVPVGYIVYLDKTRTGPAGDIALLQSKGIRDWFAINTPGPLQGTISLGLFRDRDRAEQHRKDMQSKGLDHVEIRERLGPKRGYFELRGTPAQMDKLQAIYALVPKGELLDCPAAAS